MTRTRLCALVLACMVVDAAQVEAQRQATQSQFRVWQFLPDSSRANPGGMAFNGENGDNDFHMFIALGSTRPIPTCGSTGTSWSIN
ncbi:MAG TPA: hypothetical protein VH137_01085 [Gemmatimonadales bacterium]|nr:hypothetical protein [Gemmatimonadales bacterium]